MKVFVTGVGGQLGFDVVNELKKRSYEAIGSDILDEVAADCAYVELISPTQTPLKQRSQK